MSHMSHKLELIADTFVDHTARSQCLNAIMTLEIMQKFEKRQKNLSALPVLIATFEIRKIK